MRLARLDDVFDDVDGAIHGATDAQRQPDDRAQPVADGRDAVQRALEPGAVVGVERTDALVHVVDFFAGDFLVAQNDFVVNEAGGRHAAQVEDDFEQVITVVDLLHRMADIRGRTSNRVSKSSVM